MSSRILIIEDDRPSMTLAQYLLNAAGHRTITADDGARGAILALSESPDLIICDLHLPVLTGYQVAERLRRDENWRCVPLIAVSASRLLGEDNPVVRAGFDGCISKPIEPATFVAQVEAFLAAPRIKS